MDEMLQENEYNEREDSDAFFLLLIIQSKFSYKQPWNEISNLVCPFTLMTMLAILVCNTGIILMGFL